jgi:hypothetical protein
MNKIYQDFITAMGLVDSPEQKVLFYSFASSLLSHINKSLDVQDEVIRLFGDIICLYEQRIAVADVILKEK